MPVCAIIADADVPLYEEGAYLEAEAVQGGILLKPMAVVEREKAWQGVLEVMARVHAQQPPSDKTPLEEEICTLTVGAIH